MQLLKQYASLVDRLNERIGTFVNWLTTVLVLVVCFDVFMRYMLNKSFVAVQELEWHLFALIFLVGAAYTLKHDRHVRVDVLYVRLSERTRRWIDFLGSLVFLLPFAALVIWACQNFVINSFRIGETSPDPGGLPARYIIKASIPLSFVLILLQGLAEACKAYLKLRGIDREEAGA